LSPPGSAVTEVAGLVRGQLHVAVSTDEAEVLNAVIAGIAVDVIDDQGYRPPTPRRGVADRTAMRTRATQILAGGIGRWENAGFADASVEFLAAMVATAADGTEARIGRDCPAVCTGLGGEAAGAAVTGDAAVVRPRGTGVIAEARIARLG